MDSNTLYPTSDLEKEFNKIHEKIKYLAVLYGVYKPLDIHFSFGTPQNMEGLYCFADEYGYHYCYTERGNESMHKTTKCFFELSYWVMKDQIFSMALNYEIKNRVKGKDPRRIMFEKELQLFSALGKDYEKIAATEINTILINAPYQDQLFI